MGRFKLKLYEKNNRWWWCHCCLDSNYMFNIEDIVVGTGRTKEEAYERKQGNWGRKQHGWLVVDRGKCFSPRFCCVVCSVTC